MAFSALETIVLTRSVPDHGLMAGDLGTIVHLYDDGSAEVEFVTASGRTQAVVTLSAQDIRSVQPTDLVAVRPIDKSA
ncbi:MAG: DUF4926 domain-containing protein [Planctomycetota bacterium]|nr:MAG: DUF4926 domain-containing protein [Planctomycetota bacterium]